MARHAIWIYMLCLLAAVGLVGCRGDNAGFRGETPFAGAWAGTYTAPGTPDFGTMSLTVAGNAEMLGTYQNLGTGDFGTVRGGTHPDGLFNATFTSSVNGAVASISGAMALEGTRENGLAGDGVYTAPGTPGVGFSFDLDRDSGDVSPFAGTLAGNWAVPGTTETGILTLTVSANGLMTGAFTNSGTGVGGSVKGRVLNNGAFLGAFIENGTGVSIQIEGIMDRMADGGLGGDGTFTRPGQDPKGFTFTLPNADTGGGA